MKRIFLVNPAAASGNNKASFDQARRYFLNTTGNFEFKKSSSRTHLIHLTQKALEEGYEQIVAIGGDGTANAVANGFFSKEGQPINPEACIAVAKLGTGSDYFRTLSGNSHKDWKEIVLSPKKVRADLGLIRAGQGRAHDAYFLNMSGVGASAEVVRLKEGLPHWMPKELSYIVPTLQLVPRLKFYPAKIEADEKQYNLNLLGAFISKGKFAGGGMRFGQNVELGDGEFEVTLIGEMKALETLKNIPHLFMGSLDRVPGVIKFRAKKMRIECAKKASIEMDGELCGKTDVNYELIPQAIQVCTG